MPESRKKVLLVDDEYGPRVASGFNLATVFDVDEVDNATDALQRIKEVAYSVVVLDVSMPDMDGLQALSLLRKIDPYVSVIMLTGYGTMETVKESVMLGANQFLEKPCDNGVLLDAVKVQAEESSKKRRLAEVSAAAFNDNVRLRQELLNDRPQVWKGKATDEVMHDLSSPLGSLIRYVGLLKADAAKVALYDPALARVLQERADAAVKSAQFCLEVADTWRMVNKSARALACVNLTKVAQDVKALGFQDTPSVVVQGPDSVWVMGVESELRRVVQNLVKNGFDAEATVVSVDIAVSEDQVTLSVTDNGKGMDEDLLHRVLHATERYTTKEKGSGIGLGFCKNLVGVYGGTLGMHSREGEGTCVVLTFPASMAP